MTEILLHTKLGVPPKRSVAVTRSRLMEQANEGLLHKSIFLRKLTLVSAPAGYGKTMMVSEWQATRPGSPAPVDIFQRGVG